MAGSAAIVGGVDREINSSEDLFVRAGLAPDLSVKHIGMLGNVDPDHPRTCGLDGEGDCQKNDRADKVCVYAHAFRSIFLCELCGALASIEVKSEKS